MSIFFTSDTHFFHNNIIKYCDRPFKDVDEMNEAIINNWNNLISEGDEVYHLGDMSFGDDDKTLRVLSRLNGEIYFVAGNHDKVSRRSPCSMRFQWIKDYFELKVKGQKNPIVMSHYPFQVWNGSHRGAIHLHGHSHGSLAPSNMKRLDIGVDTNQMLPYSLEQVLDLASKKGYETPDGHSPKNPR